LARKRLQKNIPDHTFSTFVTSYKNHAIIRGAGIPNVLLRSAYATIR